MENPEADSIQFVYIDTAAVSGSTNQGHVNMAAAGGRDDVGQWLLKYDSFPAESLRLHRWADGKKPIPIEVVERPVNAAPSKVQLRPSHRYGKIEVLDATLETLQDDLDRALACGSAARVAR